MRLPPINDVKGYKPRDWHKLLTDLGFHQVRRGKHGWIYRHPKYGTTNVGGSPSDWRRNMNKHRDLQKLKAAAES